MDVNRRKLLSITGGLCVTAVAGCLSTPKGNAPKTLPQPTLGEPSDSKPVLRLFEDYGCPHCRTFELEIMPKIRENYVQTGDIYVEYYDFPLPVRNMSKPAAVSGRVVQYLSDDETFWQYKHTVMKNQQNLGYSLFRETANNLDVDGEKVVKQTQSGAWDKFVEEDKQYGKSLGVPGTPALFVGEEMLDIQALTYEAISNALDEVLK